MATTRLGVVLLIVLLMSAAVGATSLSEPGTFQLLIADKQGGRAAPLLSTHLGVTIVGPTATVKVTQRFKNPTAEWINATYTLPLPDEAAVHGWTMVNNDRRLIGVIAEREEAKQRFQKAAEEGRAAGMLAQGHAGMHTVDLTNIAPESEIVLEVELSLLVDLVGREYTLRLPTTLTPRYRLGALKANAASDDTAAPPWLTAQPQGVSPRDILSELIDAVDGPPQVLARDIHYPLTWSVSLSPGQPLQHVGTPLHSSVIKRSANAWSISNGRVPAEMDRDWVLRWRLSAAEAPTGALIVDEHEGRWFGVLQLIEPTRPLAVQAPPRELILVIDVSGSMSGEAIRQARVAARVAIDRLKPADTFNVIAFDHRLFTLFDKPRHATPNNLMVARRFIGGLDADGGTEMAPALAEALRQIKGAGDHLPQVLFVTDGAVYNESSLYRDIRAHLGVGRLSTVAIGPAPNAAFMRQVAQVGRGLYRQVTRVEDVSHTLEALLASLSKPLLVDVAVEWPAGATPATGVLPDLYHGEPLRVPVVFDHYPAGAAVVVRAMHGGWPWEHTVRIQIAEDLHGASSNATVWARQVIQSYLDGAILRGESIDTVRPWVLPLALEHQLLSPFTRFIAEEQIISRPPHRRAGDYILPQQAPARAFEFPQTATSRGLLLYLGLFAAFWAVLIFAMTRDESRHGDPR